ncbi:MAG: tRNA (guanosine(46)-N7)-methyltransferase TrmB [Phycisphaerae bacterium]
MRQESPRKLTHQKREKFQTQGILLPAPKPGEMMNFREIYGNDHPVELEIGVGKGTFLVERSAARPELNFLGIEWAGAYAAYCADRFHRRERTNVRMMHADATEVVGGCLPDESLWRVHIYFPDPWPKRRHRRRRSIQLPFVKQLWRVLRPGGQLLIVTDHLDYFQQIQRVFTRAEGFCRIPFPEMHDTEGEIVGTNFERKYIAQGRPFFNIAHIKYV